MSARTAGTFHEERPSLKRFSSRALLVGDDGVENPFPGVIRRLGSNRQPGIPGRLRGDRADARQAETLANLLPSRRRKKFIQATRDRRAAQTDPINLALFDQFEFGGRQ